MGECCPQHEGSRSFEQSHSAAGTNADLKCGFPNSQLSHPSSGMIVTTHSVPSSPAPAASGPGRLLPSGKEQALERQKTKVKEMVK